MESREKLERLVESAKCALEERAAFTTLANQNALNYMIEQAEKVLRGEEIWPVSGSREFLQMKEEELLEFLYSHYVMFEFEKEKGAEEEFFGLKQALDWFLESGCKEGDAEDTEDTEEKSCFFFEKEKRDYLLFSHEEWEEIQSKLSYDTRVREKYEEIRSIADRYSLEELQAIWQDTWGEKVNIQDKIKGAKKTNDSDDYGEELYSDTAKGVSFQIPDGAVKARLHFLLPESAVRTQKFRIRNIKIVTPGGDEIEVCGDAPIVLDEEARCWEWENAFSVIPGAVYTIHFQVNQKRKLKNGIILKICYENGARAQSGDFCWEYNRKAWYPVIFFNLDMQCNAICYGVTGNLQYAQKAVYQLLLFMDDFCQGAAYWMRYNCRPEGRDNYGAVQAGRNLCSIAMTYVFVKDALTGKERELFLKLAEFILNDVFDLRDRVSLPPERVQRGTGNWQTDMGIGAAMLAAAVEEIPYRKQWIMNAEALLSAQLDCNLRPDGSWPESLRYHHAVLEHFCTFARFWEHETGENWFFKKHMDRMFAYSIGVQMPPYVYFGNRISTPPFGDHKLGGGEEYQVLAGWIGKVAETDAVLAAQMQETWERAGCPVRGMHGESIVAEQLLLPDLETEKKPFPKEYRTESRAFPDSGLYLFRKEQSGACLAVMCNERKMGHGHLDQGSFQYYYHNIPVVMDSGIEGYFDTTTQWHISSYSHACMLFASMQKPKPEEEGINLSPGNYTERLGWCNTPGTAQLIDYKMGTSEEWIRMKIQNPESSGYHLRTIIFEKDESFLIHDEIKDYEGDILFCLPMLMKQADLREENRAIQVMGTGYYGVNLIVESLRPIKKAWIDWGRVTPMYPEKEQIFKVPYLRMVADAKDGFVVRVKACD